MRNANGVGAGNDAAFDNIRVLDVTPQLDKSFSPAAVPTGGISTLTFTVTNTSELSSKSGWGFTDNLPAGLTLASSAVGGTCDATTAVTAGATSIAVTNGTLGQGEASCTITVQVTSATPGNYTNGPGNVTETGLNPPGDATVSFSAPSYTVAKTASTSVAHPGDKVTYTITVRNTGAWDYTTANPASFTDDLSGVLDDATYNGDASSGATVTGDTLSWTGAVAAGASQTITYSVTVKNPDDGDQALTNAVAPDGPGGTCDPAANCTTSTPVQSFTVTKTADTNEVTPGATVHYTVTVKNTGDVAYSADNPASFSDDLSAVTDDAAYNGDASNGATVTGNVLAWSGPLAVGATETITYSVTVDNPDNGDKHLDNSVVTPADSGGNCATGSDDPACVVNIPSGEYTVSKSASTTTTRAGDTVIYQIKVANTGERDYTASNPASFSDDLSGVLDDGKITTGPDNGATVTGSTLSWSGPLAIGETVTISYTVTVDNPDNGDNRLTNTVRPTGPGGQCLTGECTTTTPIRAFTVTKTATPAGDVHPGDTVTYKVTVTNTGAADFTNAVPASFTDDLTGVTDDAAITSGPDDGAVINGNTLSWSGPLATGSTVTITYTATINDPDAGDGDLKNTAVAGAGGSCAAEGECATNDPVQSFTIAKASSASGPVHPGDTVTYAVTVTNTGAAAYTAADPASFTDDLSKVLDDAMYVPGSASAGATVTGTQLSWSGPLAVGATQTITYQVKVAAAGSGDGTLTNEVAPVPGNGGDCTIAGECTTTNPVQAFNVTKTADATEVTPGEIVTYTVKVTNTGAAAYTATDPASFTDDLSKVTDDATYNGDATSGATVTGNTLSWSGPLAAGATVTITYSVTVNNPDTGDKRLDNTVVTPAGSGGDCPTGADNAECTSNVPSGSYSVDKTASTSHTELGGKVTYTVTVVNTGKVAYTAATPASFTDDLSNVLDDATYNKDATHGATVSGHTLTWSGPLAVGETVKITYSVTVDDPDKGNHRLVNTVIPTGNGGGCDTDGSCLTSTDVASYTVVKTVSTTGQVQPGETVHYAVTVTNTGQSAYTAASPASFKDNMSDVLDDATYNKDASHGATLSGTTLSWSGPLAVGQTIRITYSVTVDNPDTGNHRLLNTVDPTVAGGACLDAGDCATTTGITGPPPSPVVAVNTGGYTIAHAPTWTRFLWLGGAGAAALALSAVMVFWMRRKADGQE
ncbi:hypothetical protein GCM10022286_16980 [Gryllotalpicola daejeonensis]|uniref:DUF11 domain-containing protein n=2 Tax=Gryllotalpicola daejeonensis TaxID=993087 RepID=A0ABP7ZJT1_9MICO